jgi:hypothetical protein
MTVFSKRNALIGWATWVVSKRILQRNRPGHGRRNKAAAAAAVLATAAGAVLFWRKRHHEGAPADVVGEPS